MKPDVWLGSTVLTKVRRKLPDWGRGHLISYAVECFGTDDLSKEQLKELITQLTDGNAVKPDTSVGQTGTSVVLREVSLVPNRGGLGERTEHYVSGGHAGLRFGTHQDLAGWALGLLWGAKEPWQKVYATWRTRQKLAVFKPHPGASLAPDLIKHLQRRRRSTERELMALPTRPTIRQAFWGFNEGDTLKASLRALVNHHKPTQPTVTPAGRLKRYHIFGLVCHPFKQLFHPRRGLELLVTHVRPNPETAPTITLTETSR